MGRDTESSLDSVKYIEYVRLNRSGYDVLDFTAAQLETLSSIYTKLEIELEDTLKSRYKSLFISLNYRPKKRYNIRNYFI